MEVNTSLDLATVLNVSQNLSSILELEKLLVQITHTILQYSGSDRAVLVLRDARGSWFVRAIATPDQTHLCSDSLTESSNTPIQLIEYVSQTHDTVVIDGSKIEPTTVPIDPQKPQPQSGLCQPLLYQRKLLGILYLENRTISGIFTSDRRKGINLLCNQAAIALYNTQRYDQEQQQRQQLQRTLETAQLSQVWFQKLFHQSADAVLVIEDGHFVDCNTAAITMMGCANKQELLAIHPSVISPEYQPDGRLSRDKANEIMALTRKQGNHRFEWLHQRLNGETFWVEVVMTSIPNDNKTIFHVVWRDISDRKRLEQQQQQSQAQLQASEVFLQKQVSALFRLTHNEAISEGQIEQAFRELTEVTAELINVERVSIWLADTDYTKIQCADLFQKSEALHSQGVELNAVDYPTYFKTVMSTPTLAANDAITDPRTCEFRYGYLDVFNIASMLDVCIYVNGEMRGVICCEHIGQPREWFPSEEIYVRSIANLTALALEASQRQQKSQELEQAQLQLVQSEKMSALGNLVAGIAHEMNNPMGFLKGNIKPAQNYVQDLLDLIDYLLQKCPSDDPDIQEELEEIDFEFIREDLLKLLESMNLGVDRIRTISNSLRIFSRKDRDHKTEFDIHDGIDSTLLILKHRTKSNENRPEIEVIKNYGELPKVNCFPGQLNQVFMNLLANAIDAFDEANHNKTFAEIQANPNRITIVTKTLDEQQVQIRIQDNGCGMNPEVQGRIFEQGFTTKTMEKGTGLGMAIAHQIITKKHGGAIACQSELGQGTEFIISLPFV